MKSVSIHQPNYIPWLGYFYKIYQSDIFVYLDDVQFSNQGMHNYHYIKTKNGPFRIKIPVTQTLGDNINIVKTKNEIDWRKNHLDLIKINYCKSEYFEEVFSDFSNLLAESDGSLSDLNISIIEFICSKLGITSTFVRSSDLKIDLAKEERIIGICKALGCDVYYSGTGARIYQSEANFKEHGIDLKYSEYKVLNYPQQFQEFQSNVTILDFLMNCGYKWDIVLKQQI